MKKILIYLFICILSLSIIACGTKEKIEKKAAETITEKIIEDASGAKVDIEGDTIKIKDEDLGEITMGATEWPSSDLVKNIPQFKDGKVLSVVEMEDMVLISLDEVKKEDFEKYLEKIKVDYPLESYVINAEENITYGGENEDRIGVQIFYGSGTGGVSITVAKMRE